MTIGEYNPVLHSVIYLVKNPVSQIIVKSLFGRKFKFL